MKNLYRKLFYVPKHGKIQEKVMVMRVARTVVIMLVCLAAMGITAYAYFSHNISSASNVIQSANFEAAITITDPQGDDASVTPINDVTPYTVELKAGKTYSVTLKGSGTAKTGFCIITAEGCSDTYYTQQLGEDANAENGKTKSITFEIRVTADTTVTFRSHWGTSSHYDDYKNNGESDKLYITNSNIGDKAVEMQVQTVMMQAGAGTTSSSDVETTTTASATTTTVPATTTTVPATTTTAETTQPALTTTPPETTVTESAENTTSTTITEPESTTSAESTNTTTDTSAETEDTQVTGVPTSAVAE